jgi:hypothetical protein
VYISYKTTFFPKNILKLSLGRFLCNLFQDKQNIFPPEEAEIFKDYLFILA